MYIVVFSSTRELSAFENWLIVSRRGEKWIFAQPVILFSNDEFHFWWSYLDGLITFFINFPWHHESHQKQRNNYQWYYPIKCKPNSPLPLILLFHVLLVLDFELLQTNRFHFLEKKLIFRLRCYRSLLCIRNANKIDSEFSVAYFVLSFCFESMTLSG